MCCKGFWKRIVSFGLSLSLGLLIVSVLQVRNSVDTKQEKVGFVDKVVYSNEGTRIFNACPGDTDRKKVQEKSSEKKEAVTFSVNELPYIEMAGIYPLFIDSIPLPKYTNDAKEKNIQGKVILRVTFLANGKIGSISVIQNLPFGLTEKAIAAAKQIKFKPASSHGTLQNETKTIEYSFTIY